MADPIASPQPTVPSFPHPYGDALAAIGPLAVLLILPGVAGVIAVRAAMADGLFPILLLVLGALGLFLALVGGIIWLLGCLARRGARRFWHSNRPLVRWVYSEAEWRAMATARWEEERGDWLLKWAGTTVIFGLAGLLTGLLIGADDGHPLLGSLSGLLIGAALGAVMGAAIAGGSHWASRANGRRQGPLGVALGRSEVFDGSDYFRGDGVHRYVREAVWDAEHPSQLVIHIYRPKVRGAPLEEWRVAVPTRRREAVEGIRAQLAELPTGLDDNR